MGKFNFQSRAFEQHGGHKYAFCEYVKTLYTFFCILRSKVLPLRRYV